MIRRGVSFVVVRGSMQTKNSVIKADYSFWKEWIKQGQCRMVGVGVLFLARTKVRVDHAQRRPQAANKK